MAQWQCASRRTLGTSADRQRWEFRDDPGIRRDQYWQLAR